MKKEFIVKCKNCGKEFTVIEEESKFPKKEKYFCCRSCANKRFFNESTRKKISDSLYNLEKNKISRINKEKTKYFCGSKELDDKNIEISKRQSVKWFKKLIPFGFDYNTLYSPKVIEEFNKVKELLYTEYVINNLSPADIFKKYNCIQYFNNSETLLHIFKDWNFPIRGWSSAILNSIKQGKLVIPKNTFGHEQWYKTWENKEVYLRSNLELEFAKYLDDNKIKYDVEPLRIKYFDTQKQYERCAIPDFYLSETNTIVEIKSDYTLDKQNMKDKFYAYMKLGYNTKLILEGVEVDLYQL